MMETNPADIIYEDGKEFYCDVPIASAGIYSHWFAIVWGTGNEINSVNTSIALGPLVGSETDNWGLYIPIGAASMFCNIGLLFLIIVILYWWLQTAKEKRKTWDVALREQEEDEEKKSDEPLIDDSLEEKKPFTCDQCGAGVSVDDNFCPKCGDRFDGVEDDESEDKSEKKSESEDS